jgi:hypothetical protein
MNDFDEFKFTAENYSDGTTNTHLPNRIEE